MSETEKSRNEKSEIAPEPTKFFDFFKSAVETYEKNGLNRNIKNERCGKVPYCLYEDMKIILSFANQADNQKVKKFKALATSSLSHRTEESIRSRHKMFLSQLNIQHLSMIVAFLMKNKVGLKGYLLPIKGEDDKMSFIVSSDLKANGQRQQIKQIQKNSSDSLKLQDKSKFLLKKRHSENVPEVLINGRKEQKRNERDKDEQEESKENGDIQVRKQKDLSESKFKDTRELDFYITFLANYENMQKKNVICILDKLSGDLNQLVDFIQTKNQNLLWKDDEDKILENFSEQTSQSIFLLKQLKKGKHNILRRATYLGINLPEFD